MRKVVTSHFVSLDGVAERPDLFPSDWDGGDEASDTRTTSSDAVIIGRRTYDEWAPFWPDSEIEPFASSINRVDKFLATSSTPTTEWANTTVIDGDLLAFVLAQAAARRRHRCAREHLDLSLAV